jgi:hypothetical protein
MSERHLITSTSRCCSRPFNSLQRATLQRGWLSCNFFIERGLLSALRCVRSRLFRKLVPFNINSVQRLPNGSCPCLRLSPYCYSQAMLDILSISLICNWQCSASTYLHSPRYEIHTAKQRRLGRERESLFNYRSCRSR